MEHRVAAVHRSPHGIGVEDVPGHELDGVRERGVRQRVAVERPHLGAAGDERGDDVAADEARRARDERPHAVAAPWRARRRARAVPRAIRSPNRAIAEGTCSAAATHLRERIGEAAHVGLVDQRARAAP